MPIFNPTRVSRAVRRANTNRRFRVIFVLGGIKAVQLRYFLRLQNALVVVIDNAAEIEALREKHRNRRFHSFVIGDGETTRTLHETSTESVRKASEMVANSSSESGLGARIANATQAARKLVDSVQFGKFLRSLPDEALLQCGGMVSHICYELYGSISGAVFNGAAPVVSDATLPFFERLGVPIDVRFNMLESTTFAGLSERARPNAGSALVSAVHRALTGAITARRRVSYYLDLHELRPVLDNSDERDACLLQDVVAMDSTLMGQYMAMVASNHANDDEFGNIRSRVVDFMDGLDPRSDIASQVATNLRAELLDAFDDVNADPLLVDDMVWRDESISQPREELSAIFDRMQESDTEALLQAIAKPPAKYRFQINMQTAHGVEVVPEYLTSTYAVTPKQVHEFRHRMQLLHTFQHLLRRDKAPVDVELNDIDNALDTLYDRFKRLHVKLMEGRYWFRWWLVRQLQSLGEEIRDYSDRWNPLHAEQQALHRALSTTDHECNHHQRKLDEMETTLYAYVPRGSMTKPSNFVSTQFLVDAFPELLAISELPEWEQLDLLCGFAGSVNPAGLASIVKSADDRLEQIAHNIVFSEYPIQSPGHGGSVLTYFDKVIYAIPPLEAQIEVQLREQIMRLQPQARVVFCDTLAFGATVMRLRFQRFSSVQDLFQGLLASDVYDAYTDPRSGLNSIDDFDSFKSLGGTIVDGRAEFGPTDPPAPPTDEGLSPGPDDTDPV